MSARHDYPHLVADPPKEDVLRDYLAEHLDVVEPGLTLIKVEYALKNADGAAGSIDILARDVNGDVVVIELKRSNQASRQALHELEKYVALLATDRGLRIDQLRCLLLSTTWHELAVPFASFVGHVDFHVEGRVVELDSVGTPVACTPVVLPALRSGISACPIHLDLLFRSAEDRDAAVQIAIKTLKDAGVADFVVLPMTYAGDEEWVIFPFSAYLVLAEFDAELTDRLRERFLTEAAEAPDQSRWWFEQAVQSAVAQAVTLDKSVEIGTPDRFKAAFDWDIGPARAGGRFDDPLIWPDDAILGFVSGFDGSFSTSLTRRTRPAQRAAWSKLRADVDRCLRGIKAWRDIVGAWLAECEQEPDTSVLIRIYAPNDILYGLDHFARTGEAGHMPQLFMLAQSASGERMAGGTLHWDGSTRVQSIAETLAVIFQDFMDYAFAQACGDLIDLDEELCRLHGLSYRVVESSSALGDASSVPPSALELDDNHELVRRTANESELATNGAAFVAAHEVYLEELQATFDKYVWRAG